MTTAKLTDEQLDTAIRAAIAAIGGAPFESYSEKGTELTRKAFRAAAPYLELAPTPEEIELATVLIAIGNALGKRIESTSALHPKPVDPRRDKLVTALKTRITVLSEAEYIAIAEAQIAALDETTTTT